MLSHPKAHILQPTYKRRRAIDEKCDFQNLNLLHSSTVFTSTFHFLALWNAKHIPPGATFQFQLFTVSAFCFSVFQLLTRSLPLILPCGLPFAVFPASAHWHGFSISAF
jgi:hypothetical protein